ncbi:Sperm-specific class P protein [Dirofilaria immitis]
MSYITVSPALIQIPCKGGFTAHTFECVGTDRLCFRVRLKKKYFDLYRVNPPMGFLRPGQKKQIILERRPGKPGKTFLIVEYIAAPSGYDPRMPFVEGAEVGQVKIRIRAYKDQKIPDTISYLQGKAVTQHGQKFLTPAMVDDEKIEREIEELYGKKDKLQPMFEADEHMIDDDEDDDDERKKTEEKVKPIKPLPSQPKKKPVMVIGAGTVGATGAIGTGTELIGTIKGEIEKLSEKIEAMKYLIREQQREANDKLEKAISDLPYMKYALIIIIILFLSHALLSRPD